MEEMSKKLRQRAIKAPTPKQVKGKGMSPGMKKAITGAATGMSGAGLMALAKKMKKKMGKKSGGKMGMTPEQLKKIMGKPGMKPVLDSKGNPVKNLFQKDDRFRRGMRSPGRPKMGIKPLPRKRIVGRNIGKPKK